MQSKKINALNIKNYFSEIIISEKAWIKKPEKNIFLLCCEKLNVKPIKTVYIGDNYEIDIVGAKNAGLNAIWLNTHNLDRNYEHIIK